MKGISSKLVKIMAEIGKIPKLGFNAHHKYEYMREEDIVDYMRKLLVKYGLVILPSVQSTSKTGDITTVEVNYKLVDTESGEQIDIRFAGEGQDKQDKGLYKAYSGCLKYFLKQTFLLTSGDNDDPEHDEAEDTTLKIVRAMELLDKTDISSDDFMQTLISRYKTDDVNKLNNLQLDDLIARLASKAGVR